MLLAQIHHKLSRAEEESEDLLTSNVFGALKYSGRSGLDILCRFLSGAMLRDGTGVALSFGEVTGCTYHFWPWLPIDALSGSEPDVVLELEHPGAVRTLVAIEAKYKSGKSSRPTNGTTVTDQLGREWLSLRKAAQEKGIQHFQLIYLTADLAMPKGDIDKSLEELQHKRQVEADISWLSWRQLPKLLDEYIEPILIDLARLMRQAMLVHFEGVELPAGRTYPDYVFGTVAATSHGFTWRLPGRGVSYEFDGRAMFHWPLLHRPSARRWRFGA